MSGIDYYALLQVKRSASRVELKRAFRRLARRLHPDINPGDRAAEVHYRQICEAYDILSNPNDRERYDRLGETPTEEVVEPVVNYGFEGFDFSLPGDVQADIFPAIFGRQARSPRPEGERHGEDVQHTLSMSFDESLEGLTAAFQIRRLISCRTCAGWGFVAADRQETCVSCQGSGRSTQTRGFMLFAKPCQDCDGDGVSDRQPCPDCQGAGRLAREEMIAVTTPSGAYDGYQIVVPGKGNEGRGGGRTGDLHVRVQVAPHPYYTRKGDNLFVNVPITFTEAALGCRIEVPTIGGSVKVRVPAGVQSGQKLRLSGRGAPTITGAGQGDLFVTVHITTPVVHDQRTKELLKELAELHPVDPREGLFKDIERK